MMSKAGERMIDAAYWPPRARRAEYITTFFHDESKSLVGHSRGKKSGGGSLRGRGKGRKRARC